MTRLATNGDYFQDNSNWCGAWECQRDTMAVITTKSQAIGACFNHLDFVKDTLERLKIEMTGCWNRPEWDSFVMAGGLGRPDYEEIARTLYQLLDDIDTLYDACKGDKDAFYAQVARIHPKRHHVAWTDGYTVHFVKTTEAALLASQAHATAIRARQGSLAESPS